LLTIKESYLIHLERAIAYLSIAGSLMVSNKFNWGWAVYLLASISGMWWSQQKGYRHMLVMNFFFTIANCCGIYNYLYL
jgi:hypothetical protein